MFAGEPHHIQGVAVTVSLVQQLGVDPVLGRWFHDETGAVISSSLWQRLGADPGIVGRPLTLDGQGYTITGVMPESFHLPVDGITSAGLRTDVWMPLDMRERGGGYFAYGRRRPGVTFAAAEADVKRVAADIAAEYPRSHQSYTARLFDLRETVIRDIRPTLLLLFAAAGLLFLITCANAAGLLLVRSVARARETAMRVALGAGRGQLALHYFAEGLLISLAAAAGGIFLGVTLTPAIVSMAADYLPRAEEITMDWTVLLFALGAACVASVLSSLAPLWQAARTAPADALGEGVRATGGRRTRRASQLLVVSEIALAFALLAVSAILIIHLRSLSRTSPGFDADSVLTFVLSVPYSVARDPAQRVPLQRRLVAELKTIPGADEVALANQLPFKGCCTDAAILPEGRLLDPSVRQRNNLMAISSGYFNALRIPLQSGRLLTDLDYRPGDIPVVINQAAAKELLERSEPGRRIREVRGLARRPFPGRRRRRGRQERRTAQPGGPGDLHAGLQPTDRIDANRGSLGQAAGVADGGRPARDPQHRPGAADPPGGDDARDHPADDHARTGGVVPDGLLRRRGAADGDARRVRRRFVLRPAEDR